MRSNIFVEGALADCCLPENSMNGIGCSPDGTPYEGNIFYCVEVKESCPYCSLNPEIASAACSRCCAMGMDYCQVGPLSTGSWSNDFL